ncbi:hypothetical protein D3OALGA1CA_153 [Olavius algarvensis associated proteobacterium Delta 3]|nr:hypothetical protein D3OALGA1CA_153 [Olavius algarvensis associated proteobacterium Delta 3]
MIIWQGKGWLVAAIIFGCSLLANLLTNWWTGSEEYWDQTQHPFAVSLFIAGVICWFIGSHFENEPTRTLVDEETSEEFTLQPKHTLFWIPMKWWGVIAVIGSAFVVVNEMMSGVG